MDALLQKDEETDPSLYSAYLRAQTDTDLLDILQHLDQERYPARVDAARREASRRCVLPMTVHSLEERFIRGLSVVAFLYSLVLLLLTSLLTPQDALQPRWPSWSYMANGTPVSVLMLHVFLGMLRAVTAASAGLAAAPLVLLTLGGWLAIRVWQKALRSDVKWLAAGAFFVVITTLLITASPVSSVPHLPSLTHGLGGFWSRLQSIIWP